MGFREVFPDNGSFFICLAYMGTFILQGIFTRASQHDGGYRYSTTTAVLLSEFLKLLVSFAVFVNGHSLAEFRVQFGSNLNLMGLYFVPAGLYCIYNNLAFVNLANYDPTTYFLLLQMRTVVTGVMFQLLFRKILSRKQWVSLGLLTLGCIIKEYRWQETAAEKGTAGNDGVFLYTILIMVQVLCSCFAGVYNERLLKTEGQHVDVMVQNTFMYLDSIVSNMIILVFHGQLGEAVSLANLRAMAAPIVIALVINNAMIGIITSLFLKRLNSMVKVYASAVELVATAYLSWLIFGIPVDSRTFMALVLIVFASTMYSMNPVQQQPTPLPK